tara:strand:+ start:1309 stop:1671 length:363 start_codon:yes stop_codon:yes gene_type:complete
LKHTDIPVRLDFLDYIKRISSFYEREICGLISNNSLFFVKNLSPLPRETFYIDPLKYLEVSRDKQVDFCFHSHPKASCSPSNADIELSNNALIPFLVFSPKEKKFSLYNPNTEETIYFLI